MKRITLVVLTGTSFLLPIDAAAQRHRAPIASSRYVAAPNTARLARCRTPAGGRAYVCRAPRRSSVVYRYSGHPRRNTAARWVDAYWGPVYMTPRGRLPRGELRQRDLRDILGGSQVKRIKDLGRDLGLRGSLRGHWHESWRAGTTLVVSMGGRDFVELVDFDYDGRTDRVFIRTPAWR